jgi:hypothetical protein
MMTVCSGKEVFTEPGGGAMELVTLGFGKDGVIAGATVGCAVEGAIVAAAFGCGAAGAIRETGGGAGRAKRRVNGSRRRKGAGLEIAGAITESG